jgi:hypothetical protein
MLMICIFEFKLKYGNNAIRILFHMYSTKSIHSVGPYSAFYLRDQFLIVFTKQYLYMLFL